jgi:glucose/arabinose dehydrogenase
VSESSRRLSSLARFPALPIPPNGFKVERFSTRDLNSRSTGQPAVKLLNAEWEFKMRRRADRFPTVLAVVLALVGVFATFSLGSAQVVGNAACPGEEAIFSPGSGQDILVPPGYRVEVFASGLDFPTGIAFSGNARRFEVFVTEAGTGVPGRCNGAVFFKANAPTVPDSQNPFLPQVRVFDQDGNRLRVLARATSVEARESPSFLHAPTIGLALERDFHGGRLFVTDSMQGVRGTTGPKDSSRIVEVDARFGTVSELIVKLPTGDHPTEQPTVKEGFIYWSQGSVTNAGVIGHDNGGTNCTASPTPAGCPGPDLVTQHEIPCQDVVLSGHNFDSGDGHVTGGFLPHGVPGSAGQMVPAFSGAQQMGMCTGAILRARIGDLRPLPPGGVQPVGTVEPVSWGYRNPFGLRFAPDGHQLAGGLLVSENGEDRRGPRPVLNAPDRLHVVPKKVTRGGLDFHGWPDQFGFLDSTQRLFIPDGGGGDFPPATAGQTVQHLLQVPPQKPVAPLAIIPADVAAVGLDFVPGEFAGAGNPGNTVEKGDALVTREGDFGFEPGNGNPIEGHDILRVNFLKDGGIVLERFAFNCRAGNQVTDRDGRRRCTEPANQAFAESTPASPLHGINRPVDGKFGPDGAFYLVDFGITRDGGQSTPASAVVNPANRPIVQIPRTGVIWKVSRIGGR